VWVGAQSASNAQRPPRRNRARLPHRCGGIHVSRPPNSTAVQTGRKPYDRVRVTSSRRAPAICSAFAAPLCDTPVGYGRALEQQLPLAGTRARAAIAPSWPRAPGVPPAHLRRVVRVATNTASTCTKTARAAPRLGAGALQTPPCWNTPCARRLAALLRSTTGATPNGKRRLVPWLLPQQDGQPLLAF